MKKQLFHVKQVSIRSQIKKLERVFNDFIRLRDFEKGCISCGKRLSWSGAWHAGHYYNVSTSYAGLRFNEKNVHGQCNHCNTFLEGNKQGYAIGLIKRFGPKILEDLEFLKVITRGQVWTAWEYDCMIKFYKDKIDSLGGVPK